MYKKVILGAVILLILLAPAFGFAAVDNRPAIELNGVKMQAAAHIDGGNVYLPLRALGDALGYKIGWSEKSITPNKKVKLAGQFYERISEFVETPVTATAIAVESGNEQMVLLM